MRLLHLVGLLAFGLSTIQAQSLADQDLVYGFNLHNRIVSGSPVIPDGEARERLRAVFDRLSQTPVARSGAVPAHLLFYIHSPEVNAFATAGGRLYVTDGLMNSIQGDPGILAFVIGHEMAHNVRQHGIQKCLRAVERQQYIGTLRYRIANGDNRANWELTGYVIADRIASAKIERDEEHEADRLGLFMSVQAGFHPDFAIAAARTLRSQLGEQSKFGAFFSDHPRWATREQRAEQNYAEAMGMFSSLWGSTEASPGGFPPVIVHVGELKPVHQNKSYALAAPVGVRNVKGRPVELRVIEVSERGETPIELLRREVLADDNSGKIDLSVPDSLLKGRRGKQFVRVDLSHDGKTIYESQPVRLR